MTGLRRKIITKTLGTTIKRHINKTAYHKITPSATSIESKGFRFVRQSRRHCHADMDEMFKKARNILQNLPIKKKTKEAE